jgi:hypothetical protein
LWKEIEREKEAHEICKAVEAKIKPLNAKALEFIPGARRHGIIKELELNYLSTDDGVKKRKHTDSINLIRKKIRTFTNDNLKWIGMDSDNESYNFEIESDSDTSSIVWLGPKLELNTLGDKEKTLPRYEFNIGTITCDSIIDSGAGSVYLDAQVAKYLFERDEINVVRVPPRNVKLANGNIEKVTLKAKFHLTVDGNSMPMEAYLINLPEMDLVLGLPWLCATRAVPDYDYLSYTLIDDHQKVVNVRPNETGLKTLMSYAHVNGDFLKLALETSPDSFREVVGLPKKKEFEHDIDTGTAAPVKVHGRPYSPPEHQLIDEFVKEGLKDGIIRPSKSPWSAPIILVKKPDGSSRACVDYRKLNYLTVKDSFPLPRIDDAYQFLQGARIFSSIDLKSGFWQIKLTERSIPKTAFATRNGEYEFLVMPFGLCNVPATFQHMMNSILKECLGKYALVYMDDIIVFSKTKEEHAAHIKRVFELLKEYDLVVSEKKCKWGQEKLLFLGHVVDGSGINVDDKKIAKIKEWPVPTNITQVRGFLNLAKYYKRFIKNFSKIATPLYKLTQGSLKKGAEIEWGEDQAITFKNLKYHLARTVILHHPKPFNPFVLDTDASGQNIGAVLQQDPDSEALTKEFDLEQYAKTVKNHKLKPIAYKSRKLSKTEQNYSAQERELLAIVHALKHFRGYIEGSPILVRTDHESLKYFKTLPA